jgi:hypothetical protein
MNIYYVILALRRMLNLLKILCQGTEAFLIAAIELVIVVQGVPKKVTSIEITLLLLISVYCTSGNLN